MADTIDGLADRLMARRRNCRMRREKFAETMAQLGGAMGNLEGAGLVASGIKAGAQIGGGFAAKDAADFEAKQLRERVGEARAAGQRAAMEKDADTAKVLGQQKAIAAASGTALTSPTLLDLFGETAQRGKYLADVERYKGEAKAKELTDKAEATKMKGRTGLASSILEGMATGAGGVARYSRRTNGETGAGSVLGEDILDEDLVEPTGWQTTTRRARYR